MSLHALRTVAERGGQMTPEMKTFSWTFSLATPSSLQPPGSGPSLSGAAVPTEIGELTVAGSLGFPALEACSVSFLPGQVPARWASA